jgi:hypothetical protein
VRTRFGGYAKWRAGYASTLASRPQDVRVNKAPDGSLTVRHVLVARDKSACGAPLERRFSVTWRLVGTPSRLTVASLAATALGPAVRAPSCP